MASLCCLTVNFPNSQLDPTQVLDHLGFTFDFVRGEIAVPQYKRKAYRKEVGKLLTKGEYTMRKNGGYFGKDSLPISGAPRLACFHYVTTGLHGPMRPLRM